MHVLTHALVGAIIVFPLFTSTLWSHSIIFASIFVLTVALVTKKIFREII